MQVAMATSVAAVPRPAWDALDPSANPFVAHDFLLALEQSRSVGKGTGWQPVPLIVEDAAGVVAGVAPAYLKEHSQGEYVFDHGWAEAWMRAGGQYYPKLLIAAPFSPVPGPRLLARDDAAARALIAGAEAVVAEHGLSSAHANFVTPAQLPLFADADWIVREGVQFHWTNDGYRDFDDFLDRLSSRKRKAIRRERAAAQAGLTIAQRSGAAITDADRDAFWAFYQDTGARKWGRPYLTRAFFDALIASMGERVLMVMAERDGRIIAGAMNLIGSDTLYGRYWGAVEHVPFLHFELCYYQAIDAAIARGLRVVEAGAQGEHKLARGYLPTPTWSAHHIPHAGFHAAVADFCARERAAMGAEREFLGTLAPFRRDG